MRDESVINMVSKCANTYYCIVRGNIVDKANKNDVRYSFLLDAYNEFHRHGQDLAIHLSSDRHTRSLFIKDTGGDRSILWNPDTLAMWARAANRMHALLFLLMHFTCTYCTT